MHGGSSGRRVDKPSALIARCAFLARQHILCALYRAKDGSFSAPVFCCSLSIKIPMSCFFFAANSSSVMMPASNSSLYFLISATASVAGCAATAAAAAPAVGALGASPACGNATRINASARFSICCTCSLYSMRYWVRSGRSPIRTGPVRSNSINFQ